MNIPEIWIGQLQNGMKILGMEYTELPVVQFTIILNSGMLCETADKSGVAMLTAAVMNSGTRMKTAEELEAAFKIRTIPTLLLCRMDGNKEMMLGTMGKPELRKVIEGIL